jgi:hypothetical protein
MALLVALSAPTAGLAQVCGSAAEFAANTYTPSLQTRPAVAVAPDGTFVVAWQSLGSFGDDTEFTSVQARRFGRTGPPLEGAEFQVNSITTGWQVYPAVAVDGDGRFVIVWMDDDAQGPFDSDVRGRLFAADATPLGGDFQINSFTPGIQGWTGDVGFDSEGDFVVVWSSSLSPDSDTSGYSVRARRFSAAGTPLGDDFQVNSHTPGNQWFPRIAVNPSGAFVVAWTSLSSTGDDTSEESVQARRYAADGTPLGAQFQVNSYTTGAQGAGQVVFRPGDGFLVTWGSNGSSGTDDDLSSIQARLFDANGDPEAPEIQVNSFTTGVQSAPVVAVDSDGSYVISFYSRFSAGTDNFPGSVQMRGFDSNGSPRGPDSQVNVRKDEEQHVPAIAMHASGDFVIAWQSEDALQDADGYGIAFRRFHNRPLLCDGFESGDTSAWSLTIP